MSVSREKAVKLLLGGSQHFEMLGKVDWKVIGNWGQMETARMKMEEFQEESGVVEEDE